MNNLICIKNKETNPYFNLALEEYLLKNKEEDIFILWQNEPTVVVGKHQNVYAEINYNFLIDNNIKVARRLSGGGAVYHDLGNLNFSYIISGEKGKLIDFAKYTDDIIAFLQSLNIPAVRNKRNDLTIANKKISGNAEHIFKNRVLHHGTLLFNSNLDILNEAITAKGIKFTDKAVQSVRSNVMNISDFDRNNLSSNDFFHKLFDYIVNLYPNAQKYEINNIEKHKIQQLQNEKYNSWDWIFAYSPKFELNKKITISNEMLQVKIIVNKGIITTAEFSGDSQNNKEYMELTNFLINKKHDKNLLLNSCINSSKSDFYKQIVNEIF